MRRLFRRGAKAAPAPAQPLELSRQAVEGILQALGLEARSARMQVASGFGWHFQRGSALIEIYLTPEEQGYLQVLSPILHLPPGNLLALYRRLLELNLQLTNAALGLHEDVVYLYHERLLAGLDAVEADAIIRRLAGYADELDDALAAEFGGRLYGRG
ncbi:MAG: YbjN domain-containing protein [Chloroflexi bacterium]|nr:YbjN domain-containing protein [Chloroflexota bacterium]MCY3583650.1 YbjN domain-containing protein [Chloroflexota bacterium]MCY3715520.1 YbjN domain-containing protein [Chloroflexota bacterium]MDE2650253.1 YbjN domain-containing protein [Chloroflexota bacterium]MXX49940.1 YbjN domain-containing protein [Chloroflexota bacterium]